LGSMTPHAVSCKKAMLIDSNHLRQQYLETNAELCIEAVLFRA
jgi:hypothetical protein